MLAVVVGEEVGVEEEVVAADVLIGSFRGLICNLNLAPLFSRVVCRIQTLELTQTTALNRRDHLNRIPVLVTGKVQL